MKLGVILLNYRNAQITIECIKSIKATENVDYEVEIIVVDNNSNDNSVEELNTLRRDIDFHFLISEENNGFADGNNIGIQYALEHGCKYIMLLNNDTEVKKDFFKLLNSELKESIVLVPKILNYYHKETIWYAGGSINRWTGKARHFGEGRRDVAKYNTQKRVSFASGCCIILPVDIIEKIGYLKKDFFLYWEDVEYSMRMNNNSIAIVYNPQLVIYHKINSTIGRESKTLLYYGTRNRILFIKLYRKYFHFTAEFITVFVELSKAVLYRVNNKEKSRIIIHGLKDGIRNISGKTL